MNCSLLNRSQTDDVLSFESPAVKMSQNKVTWKQREWPLYSASNYHLAHLAQSAQISESDSPKASLPINPPSPRQPPSPQMHFEAREQSPLLLL